MAETGARRWIITGTVVMAALLELIDTTVVNVSLPQIMGNLGATLADVGWVVTSYAIANVIILPMSGWLGARFGRRNYFVFSIVIFTISSFFSKVQNRGLISPWSGQSLSKEIRHFGKRSKTSLILSFRSSNSS